jgi:hypothetical protein
MSKKSKKQSRKVTAPATPTTRTTNGNGGKSVTIGAKASETQFNPNYSSTLKDLRRIGILAGTFFTILIILSFFLR